MSGLNTLNISTRTSKNYILYIMNIIFACQNEWTLNSGLQISKIKNCYENGIYNSFMW